MIFFKRLIIGWMFMVLAAFASGGVAASRPLAQSEPKPLVIILMGPPGAGKGTHASPLSAHTSLPHISTGDLFRENIRSQTELGKKAKMFIDLGKLVPDELVLDMLFDRVSKGDCKNGYILDGFPRTLQQAKALNQKIRDQYRVLTLNFQLSDADIIQRVSSRIACKQCGRPYNKQFDKPKKEGVCDACEGTLYQRDDDREEVVLKRLEVYRAQTLPLIDYYSQQEGVLRQIDSQKGKDLVFQEVLKAVFVVER